MSTSRRRSRVFNLNYSYSWLMTAPLDSDKPWAVVPPCHAGCRSAHHIGWDGIAFATWREAVDHANGLAA